MFYLYYYYYLNLFLYKRIFLCIHTALFVLFGVVLRRIKEKPRRKRKGRRRRRKESENTVDLERIKINSRQHNNLVVLPQPSDKYIIYIYQPGDTIS